MAQIIMGHGVSACIGTRLAPGCRTKKGLTGGGECNLFRPPLITLLICER